MAPTFGCPWSLVQLPCTQPPHLARKSVSSAQSKDRQPIEAAERGFPNGRGGTHGGHRAGYEVAKGQYLIVEDGELDAVQIESTRTIDIDQFVPKREIDERYIDSPYYIAPDGQVGQDAFADPRHYR